MKRFLTKLAGTALAVGLIASTLPFTASAAAVTDFTDVKPKAWYYGAVEYAADNGLFSGTSTSTFSPDAGMTRGMFVKVLGSKARIDESQYLRYRFDDVKQGMYYAPYVEWAAGYGIVTGKSETKFKPDELVTREQMAAILYRYAQKTGNDVEIGDGASSSAFPDASRVSGYAVDAMNWAVNKGILKGSGGKLLPQGTATRAQVAQVFLNAKDLLVKTEIDEEPALPPEKPHIDLTPEQRAQLTKDQDPDEVLRQVLAETSAKWDPSLNEENACCLSNLMYFGITPDGKYTTEDAAYWAKKYLYVFSSDKFYMKVYEDLDSSYEGLPGRTMNFYFTVPDRKDSVLMKQARALIEKAYPNAIFQPYCPGGQGYSWMGGGGMYSYEGMHEMLGWSQEKFIQSIAEEEISNLSLNYKPEDTFCYWMCQGADGDFFLFY